MRKLDIVFLYEHVARELDVACAVTALLRQRNISVEILQWPTSFRSTAGKFDPKLVVLPFCYTERSFLPILHYWSRSIFFNMTWEQLFYSGNLKAKTPRGEFATRHVIHHSWSQVYADFLRKQGIPEEYIIVNGHPSYQLYKAPYRDYFLTREALAQKYNLDPSRKWIFFPENYNWAFYTEATIQRFLEAGQSASDIEEMRHYCTLSLQEVLRWFDEFSQSEQLELIIRPRPATHMDDFRSFVHDTLGEKPYKFHVIQRESVREWILASDLVLSSHSTSLIEAALAGKAIRMLEPYPMPGALHVEWHDLVPRIHTKDEFVQACYEQSGEITDTRLADWAGQTLLSTDDAILNVANVLERLVRDQMPRPPRFSKKRYLTLAKRIIPLQLWALYHQKQGREIPIQESFRKDVVSAEEMESRVNRWQSILKGIDC